MAKKLKLNGTVVSDRYARVYDYFGIANISPGKVSAFLAEADGDDIEVTINSGGGDVYSGADIFTEIMSYEGNSTAKIVFAASAASVFAMGFKNVLMSPAGQMMIHNASTVAWGDRNTMDNTSGMLRSVDESIANAYVAKTGMARDELLALMDKETWMDAVKAKELGFIDDVMFAEQAPQLQNNVAAGGEMLPQEVIDKVLNELKAMENKSPLTNSATTPKPPVATKQPEKTPENKEEPRKMDINQLKAEHPDLFAQITNDAQKAERERVVALQAYAKHPGAEAFVNEAIANGGDVAGVALKFMEASMKRNGDELKNRQDDATASGADKVENLEATNKEQKDEQEKTARAERMAAKAAAHQNKNGGRK